MSRTTSIIALACLVVVFLLELADYLVAPYSGFIPAPIAKLVAAVLVGVTIGLILNGFRRTNGNGHPRGSSDRDEHDHAWDERDRPSMRQGLDHDDPHRTDLTGGHDD